MFRLGLLTIHHGGFIMASGKRSPLPEIGSEEDGDTDGSANPTDARVGSRIRTKRILLGYSLELLSEELGVTVEQLASWESGASRVGADRLRVLSEVLREPPSAFFDSRPDRRISCADGGWAEREPTSSASSAECLELIWAFSRILDAEERKTVVAFAASLARDRRARI